jgi:hypothetical protein
LRGAWASLDVGLADSYLVAKTQTDEAGRFFFCRVNAAVRMGIPGSHEPLPIPGTRDMSFEIEVKP